MYEYQAFPIHVVDGDTVDLRVDLGFGIARTDRFRLYGINTPELHAKDPLERERAVAAQVCLTTLLGPGPVVVQTFKDKQEKYGRYLARILVGSLDVNAELLRRGHGIPYMVAP